MKTILHVIDSLDPTRGGPPQCVRNLAEGFSNLGCVPEIVCGDAPESVFLKTVDPRVKVHAVGPSCLGYGFCPALQSWLNQNASRFDKIVIHGIWQFHSVAAWRAARKNKVPYCIFTHGMLDSYFKKAYPLKHLKKWVYWNLFEYYVIRDASGVLFTSQAERESSRKTFRRYRAQECVVDYGVEPPPQENGQEQAWSAKCPEIVGKRYLIYLGRIHEKKGIDLTIEAFVRIAQKNPDIHLVIAGENANSYGTKMGKQSMANQEIVSRIHWVGMLQGKEKWGALKQAEAFLLHSHQENFGKAVAEALACGTPVLISDKINIYQEVLDAGAGIVSSDTLEGAEETLIKWLSLEEKDKQTFRIRARQLFENKYNILQNIRSISDIIFRQP